MNKTLMKNGWLVIVFTMMILVVLPVTAKAVVNGITGPTFNLTAKAGRITMGDGSAGYIWGYAAHDPNNPNPCPAEGCVQYPGPVLIVNQGQTVTVHLTNSITRILPNPAVNVSIVFPGQNVTATGGVAGLLTNEAVPGGAVTYTFTPMNPGTYSYYSGTQSWLQVEMGLIGALIVRPVNGVNGCVLPAIPSWPAIFYNPASPTVQTNQGVFAPVPVGYLSASRGYAYCTSDAYYDHEYLFLVTEIDPSIHRLVEFGQMAKVDNTAFHPTDWFINGRDFSDTTGNDYDPWLPVQPYAALPLAHPGENFLIRFVGGGRGLHPMHPHGQNHNVIARDGQLLQSATGAAARRVDLPISDFTTTTVPGETADALWGPWTGMKLNWDVYGHSTSVESGGLFPKSCTANSPAPEPAEYLADHCKAFPVKFPGETKMSYGQMWGGSPFMGVPGDIPPIDFNTGEYHSNQNPMAAQSFMFHSHSEREITTNNIFIGGAATMMMILPYTDVDGAPIVIP